MASKKYALITGCSDGGIGPALALEFQKRGIHVFATSPDISKMSNLKDIPNITLFTLDVTSSSSISSAVKAVSKITGEKLDYLVNNAGSLYIAPVLDSDTEVSKRMFEVNFWGLLEVTRAFAPLLIRAKGCIANSSSLSGEITVPWYGLYSASKSAVTSLSESLRLELSPFGVRVVTLVSGFVQTELWANSPCLNLPEASIFRPFESNIAKEVSTIGPRFKIWNPMNVKLFAEQTVADIIGGQEGKVWRGTCSTFVRLSLALAPRWLRDMMARNLSGLNVQI